MEIGTKLWTTNHNLYEEFAKNYRRGLIDFLELKYIIGHKKNLEVIKENQIPVIIHAPTEASVVSFGDSNLQRSLKIFHKLEKAAEYLNAKGIIIHPSVGSKENFIKFLKVVNNEMIIVENMPSFFAQYNLIGNSPEEIKEFLEVNNFKFCFDFAHAVKAAVAQNKDPTEYIDKFLKLNPYMFHFSDGDKSSGLDRHLKLGAGNFNLSLMKKQILASKSRIVTLETPKKNYNSLNDDLENIYYFKRL